MGYSSDKIHELIKEKSFHKAIQDVEQSIQQAENPEPFDRLIGYSLLELSETVYNNACEVFTNKVNDIRSISYELDLNGSSITLCFHDELICDTAEDIFDEDCNIFDSNNHHSYPFYLPTYSDVFRAHGALPLVNDSELVKIDNYEIHNAGKLLTELRVLELLSNVVRLGKSNNETWANIPIYTLMFVNACGIGMFFKIVKVP